MALFLAMLQNLTFSLTAKRHIETFEQRVRQADERIALHVLCAKLLCDGPCEHKPVEL